MAEENIGSEKCLELLMAAIKPFEIEIARLERDYGFDRPDHQGQCLMLPLSDLKKLQKTLKFVRDINHI
jgi:hypothetical protein